ncbi:arsenical pump-driving ATPase [Pseudohalocynthiibacter aestuariivivens]|jgi:arsenite/tail-anchored protein-transporting ATPase|uniref:Arsenical pump-driving ATPase n=1 Tax=Pseudohalocynthiibacter aestuariivivens TaxID=1591409 RepID=A0ABV5JIW1_9RHOB|nr:MULTISPECIES: arsenical pump-driving ATPase [Pseudohalocynthiibacter]MBS9718184.1 arsenical pump-driving ATPase [Pseudohalocynthiibacter aestuariivivens]MCK0103834.1 arsenical pump-driving ATPase [Pseudohalocynthiibacter sp. F2068]
MFKSLPKFVFFTGKGGVGKTSLACATTLDLASKGKMILLVSTDPASNVGQVFEREIGNRITKIATAPGVDAIEINPEEAAADYRERIVGPMRGVLPEVALKSIEEQLSGACTIEIAAFDEFTALLTDNDLVDRYDHVIFDTAPTGHTIRMLKLPGAWSGFLEAGKGDASCLGPLAGLEKQRDRYAAAVDRLSDRDATRLVLVARPRHSALAEVARTSSELAAIGIRNQHLAINGMMPEETGGDLLASALLKRDQDALAGMTPEVAALPRTVFALRSENLVGLAALKRFAAGEEDVVVDSQSTTNEKSGFPTLGKLVDDIEGPGKGLIMFMGKGGVGKTTMAAAVASELSARGHEVLLTTTDPAAHISETLAGDQPGLTVSRIDPAVETANYHAHVMATKGKDLDDQARAMLEEDLRSPCTEEIAVFQAFSRVIRESGRKFVIMDTAPTGHTLLLLDATGSYHKDILRHQDKVSRARLVTPMMRLQDPQQTKIMIVTLPETTPVLEAAHLQNDLRRAGIEPWGWIINSSLAAAETSQPLLRKRAQSEHEQIAKVRDTLSKRYAVVPIQAVEPVGVERLKGLCRRALDSAAA